MFRKPKEQNHENEKDNKNNNSPKNKDKKKQRKKVFKHKDKQRKSRLVGCLVKLILIALCLYGGYKAVYPYYQTWQRQQELLNKRPAVKKASDGTSTSAAWHSLKVFHQNLKKNYSFLYRAAYETPSATSVGRDFIVPGLVATDSYDYQQKKLTTSRDMTPQGIAVVQNYLLIAAYDGGHRHASVIYVLDKKTGKFLKTIRLSGKPHLGGIAYDSKGMQIWVTSSKDGQSALATFSLAKLIEYVASAKKTDSLVYDQEIPITKMASASALCYYADQLFVGYFNNEGRGKVSSYKIARNGQYKNSITTSEISSVDESISWSDPDGSTSMNKQIQGIAISGDKIFLSQSYGGGDSKLYIFPITAISNLDEKNATQVVRFPPYLEQITAYQGQLICVFESGSRQYARDSITVMDRTLSVNISALLNNN